MARGKLVVFEDAAAHPELARGMTTTGRIYQYAVVFEPQPEGGYNVVVPAIPEICTFGRTLEEAREMARDAIRCVIEGNLQAGESIPLESAHLP